MKAVTCTLGGMRIGIDLRHVEKLIRVDGPVRALAGTPPSIRGLLDVRGRVVTLLDTATILEADAFPAVHAAVLCEPGGAVALLLPEQVEILPVEEVPTEEAKEGEDPPWGRVAGELVERLGRTGEGMAEPVVLLDPPVMLSLCRGRVRAAFLARRASREGGPVMEGKPEGEHVS